MESMDAFKTTTPVDPTKKDQTHTQLYSTFNFQRIRANGEVAKLDRRLK